MNDEVRKFLDAEKNAEKLVESLEKIISETSSYQTAKEELEDTNENLLELIKSIEKDWDEIKHIDNQKDYALIAKTKPWSGILFDLKKGKVSSVETYLRKNARVDYILKLCGLDKEKESKEIE